jgi:hypothetical protein
MHAILLQRKMWKRDLSGKKIKLKIFLKKLIKSRIFLIIKKKIKKERLNFI